MIITIACIIAAVCCAIIGIISGITIYVLLIREKNTVVYTDFADWIKGFFRFEFLIYRRIITVIYLILTIAVTLFSFAMLFTARFLSPGIAFMAFITVFAGGNLSLRFIFECLLAPFMSYRLLRNSSHKQDQSVKVDRSFAPNMNDAGKGTTSLVICRNCANSHSAADDMCPYCGQRNNN